MSEAPFSEAPPPVLPGYAARLPQWGRPRQAEQRGSGRLRLIETTVLVMLGLLLAVATVNDVVRQTHINGRLIADLRTWRSVTGHNYHGMSLEQDIHGLSTLEIVCGNTAPGPPRSHVQLCLTITGPVVRGVRETHGGWYLPAGVVDLRIYRYACFGTAIARGRCPR